ncbi:cation diffusion facilitator family transporter [Peptostreptococcus canis]|uniref:Cation transporter n=1 Tax=Peptostreptococcus canis TaxID=1159213 RepID=A0ABR6TIW6_9FIRM|nr:cation diffusion facilitator family transporter [Peptostreptococcus canis]MBC2575345.1 cation transporter [Peptostreptococcus canis]MBP1997472.1 cation diffusion facilitator family transporter [Peptostreptococcus canis]
MNNLTAKEVLENKIINKVSSVGIFGNIFLTAFKLMAGIFANSGAMISDAMHSLSDVFATLIAFIGVKLSKKEPDKEHPYGHDRFESVASIILALILLGTGVAIGYTGLDKIINYKTAIIEKPGIMALIAAIVSILIKESMFWYTRYYAKKINSQAFLADAWHHRSDALSSVGALIGIGLARLGYPIFDPIASIIICALIIKVGYDIFIDGFGKMMDKSCSDEIEEKIRVITLKQDGILGIDVLRTREFGAKMFVDIEITVDGDLSLRNAHRISEILHDRIEKEFPDCKHCMVHVNPDKK